MNPCHRAMAALTLATFALAGTGCHGETATVEGTVTYRGEPLKSGSVILYCADKQLVRRTIVDGRYSIPNVPRGPAGDGLRHGNLPEGLRLRQELPPTVNGRNPTASG